MRSGLPTWVASAAAGLRATSAMSRNTATASSPSFVSTLGPARPATPFPQWHTLWLWPFHSGAQQARGSRAWGCAVHRRLSCGLVEEAQAHAPQDRQACSSRLWSRLT